jgi:hypothetical protein
LDAIHAVTQEFPVYGDGIAPVSRITLSGAPQYLAAGRQFYGRNLRASFSATDEMSGLAGIYVSARGEAFQPAPATVPFTAQGDYKVKYYAVDRVGNVEAVREIPFTVDTDAPRSQAVVSNPLNYEGVVLAPRSNVTLTAIDSLAGVQGTFYAFNEDEFKPYQGGALPIHGLIDGEHTIRFYSMDRVANRESEKTYTFYYDKTVPIVSADILGDRFVVGTRVYFSGRTQLKLTAVDNRSGIDRVLYSIDNAEYQRYDRPFYLPKQSGVHTVKFYAFDRSGNKGADPNAINATTGEYEHKVSAVYVDLTGPALSFDFLGPKFQKADTLYISPRTQVKLSATDPEAGLRLIAYSIDADTSEKPYGQPFTISQPGLHIVKTYGYDNVNNRNVRETSFVVDTVGPEVFLNFSTARRKATADAAQPAAATEEVPEYPSYVTLFIAAEDAAVGIGEIRYSLNGGKETEYKEYLKGFEKNKTYTLRVTAKDKLGNSATRTFTFRTANF